MNEKRTQMVGRLAAPYLMRGEQIEMTVYANIGSVSTKRFVATAAIAAVATGGMGTVFVRPRHAYLSITSNRLMFFDGETATGRPGKLLFTVSRQAVAVAGTKKGLLTLKVDLAVHGQDKGLRLVFPTMARKKGEQAMAILQSYPNAAQRREPERLWSQRYQR
jgi:hypothetical protein